MNTTEERNAGINDFKRHMKDGVHVEDTFTCSHCRRFTRVPALQIRDALKAAKPSGATCRGCMRMICADCVPRGRCNPFENAFRAAQDKAAWWRSFERAAGNA